MNQQTKAGEAFIRLSTVLNLLHAHPGGLRLDYLADEVGVPEAKLRQEILDFYAADTLGVRPDTILFVSTSGSEDDPASADVVRVVSDQPSAELGVELLSAQQWLEVYKTVQQVAQMMPEDQSLAEAVDIIGARILADVPSEPDTSLVALAGQAIRDRRVLHIEYSRAWKPGTNPYDIKPLRLVQTRRGWELDALVAEGGMRTFILDRIRNAAVTEESFETPEDADELLAASRQLISVDLVVPLGFQWAVDRYAEHTEVTDQDEGDLKITAQFLPPAAERVGRVLITAPNAFVMAPVELRDAGAETARLLLEHHGL